MNNHTKARTISISLFAIFFGGFYYAYYHRCSILGKDAYLIEEAARFDRHMIHPSIIMSLAGALFVSLVFVIYEVVTVAIFKAINFVKKQKDC